MNKIVSYLTQTVGTETDRFLFWLLVPIMPVVIAYDWCFIRFLYHKATR